MMTDIDAYEAALSSAAYFHQADGGFLRVGDRDRVDFLQRQTTNDLRRVRVDHSVATVLTSPTARILDVFCVVDEGEWLGVITLPGRSVETTKFLRGRIFFSDQVTVEDASGEVTQILLFGPQVNEVMEKLGLQSLEPDHAIRCRIADQLVTVLPQKILASTGYRLLVPVTSVDAIVAALSGTGATSLNPETFEILRVEAGQPGPVGELVEVYTPLEVRLNDMISDSKGCYTGQEIIARQITYDKVAKNLVGIKLNDLLPFGAEIKIGEKSVGSLTSVAQSPRFGAIGLGVVRRPYCEMGKDLSIFGADGETTGGKIVKIPFR